MSAALLCAGHMSTVAISQTYHPVTVGLITVCLGGTYMIWLLIREARAHTPTYSHKKLRAVPDSPARLCAHSYHRLRRPHHLLGPFRGHPRRPVHRHHPSSVLTAAANPPPTRPGPCARAHLPGRHTRLKGHTPHTSQGGGAQAWHLPAGTPAPRASLWPTW